MTDVPDSANTSMDSKDKPFYEAIFTKLKSRNWTGTLRDISSFADPKNFSKPRNTEEALARLETNINYYLTNYIIICAFIIVYAVLRKPLLVIVVFLLVILWTYVVRFPEVRVPVHSSLEQFVGTRTLILKGQQKLIITGTVTALVVLLTAGTTIFMVAGICSIVVGAHAALHIVPEIGIDSDGNFNQGGGTLTSIGHSHIEDLESGSLFPTDPVSPNIPKENHDYDDSHPRRLGKQAIEMTTAEVSRKE